jgi:hypothetical protein
MTKSEMRMKYGTPAEFWRSLMQSVSDMQMPRALAQEWYEKYWQEWNAAKDDKHEKI